MTRNRRGTVCQRLGAAGMAGLMLTALAGPGGADTVAWKTVGRWDISYYPGAAGCQAFAVFGGGTAFFIGYDARAGQRWLDVTLLDRRWQDMQPGQTYDVTVRFGRETPWTVSMEALVIEEFPGLNILIDARSKQAARFIDEFQRKGHMEWTLGDKRLGRYALRGSFRAFNEVRACQSSHPTPQPVTQAR